MTMPGRPPSPYPVPAGPVDGEIVITKSRFVAALRPVGTRAAVLAELAVIRAAHPGASHHCHAYLIGSPQSGQAGMSDDGEPSGTAGRPIFSVIEHRGVGDVLVVVTRYFGGIKLGAGGLVRAYSGAAQAVLSKMTVVTHQPVSRVTLTAAFADEQAVRHWCSGRDATIDAVDYGERVRMALSVPRAWMPELTDWCAARQIGVAPGAV